MSMVDLTVIGGGIVGLGVAQAAVRRGLSVIVCERGPLAAETSANSHCIIHSGVRYFQHGAIARVLASARSLADLRAQYPEQVVPLPCWMPLRQGGLRGSVALRAGHLLYQTLLRVRGVAMPQWPGVVPLSRLPEHPLLRGRCSAGAFGWVDGWLCDHHGLVERIRQEITTGGGVIRERTPVVAVRRDGTAFVVETPNGEIFRSTTVVDARGASIRHSLIVNESGVFASSTDAWCVGFNIALSVDLSEGCGIAVAADKGRLLFVAPRCGTGGARSAIGTGYLALSGDEVPAVSEEYVASLVGAVAKATGVSVSLADVVGVESGVLPRSAAAGVDVTADPATRLLEQRGYLVVKSGKYTTFPVVGEQVVSALVTRLGRRIEK